MGIAIALFLGLAVGGLTVVGTVAIAGAQQNHVVQLDNTVSQLNAHDFVRQICVQAQGGGSPQDSRTYEIVPVSECKTVSGLNTEQGVIEVIDSYMTDPLPLCIDNDAVASWYVILDVYGGYTPYDGFVCVQQKNEFVGKLILSWEDLGPLASCGEEWKLTYSVSEPFELDSNQYPVLVGDDVIAPPGYQTIPGKEVNLYYHSFWKGCQEPNQYFTIILAQQKLVFLDLPLLPPNSTVLSSFT